MARVSGGGGRGDGGGGRPVVVSDGPPPRTAVSPGSPAVSEHLWLHGVPKTVDAGGDRGDDGWPLEAPAGGASFPTIQLPPPTRVDHPQWLRVSGDDPERPRR